VIQEIDLKWKLQTLIDMPISEMPEIQGSQLVDYDTAAQANRLFLLFKNMMLVEFNSENG